MREASNIAAGVDKTFYLIIGVDLFFLIGITAAMIYFIIRYNRKRHPKANQIKDNPIVETTWTIVPFIIVMVMFYYGYSTFTPQQTPAKDAVKIDCTAKMWYWSFKYANGKESDKLYLPYNKNILLTLTSVDVVHGFFIPAFRIKKDVVPGRMENYLTFIPTIKDTFDIFCTSYCGMRHSYMLSKAIVLDDKDFQDWLGKADTTSKGEMPGLTLIKKNGCVSCHSLDGSRIVGPSFKGIYGRQETILTPGGEKTINVDDKFIKAHIIDPKVGTVKTYPAGIMKSYKDDIKDEEITQIIDYFKTLK